LQISEFFQCLYNSTVAFTGAFPQGYHSRFTSAFSSPTQTLITCILLYNLFDEKERLCLARFSSKLLDLIPFIVLQKQPAKQGAFVERCI